MLQHKTVFILGAGASCDYDYPAGLKLLKEIKDAAQNATKNNYGNQFGGRVDMLFSRLAETIEISPSRSIDTLLATYTEYMDIGKFLIATRLLPRENPAAFKLSNNRDEHWMLYLCQQMHGKTVDEFLNNPIVFVTFNYDRCLEFWLRHYIVMTYRVNEADANTLLKRVKIIHVHGHLGSLQAMPYEIHQPANIAPLAREAAKGIRIIHEADPESEDFKAACTELSNAERVGILGFGYLRENMDRLRFKETLKDKIVFGTCFKMFPPELRDMRSRLIRSVGKWIAPYEPFINCECLDLLRKTDLLY